MEQSLSNVEGMKLQTAGFIEQAICKIYDDHPHEVKTILFAAVSLMFGYSAYKEYGLTKITTVRNEV